MEKKKGENKMINIEIRRGIKGIIGEEAEASLILMEGAIIGEGMDKKVVIEEICSKPQSCGLFSAEMPYLRISSESKEEIEKIVNIIRKVGLTEYFFIKTILEDIFIPKK